MLGKRVKESRKRLGFTQKQLGEKVGVTQESIRKIEAGETELPHYIKELSVALEVDLNWLLNGTGAMKKNESPIDNEIFDNVGALTLSQKQDVADIIKKMVSKNKEILKELSFSSGGGSIYSNNHAHA